MTLSVLIDRPDNFEVVRDQIAQILANETVAQQALAVDGGKEPLLWAFRVFTERAAPWEPWLNQQTDTTPIINVWWDGGNVDGSASNPISRQTHDDRFNIDVFAPGLGDNDQIKGDEAAARNVQRVLRLVRTILMSPEYIYLELRGVVTARVPSSRQSFQPQIENSGSPYVA
ncbi:MAG: hypothetical protein KAJ19_12955, partial [Gammaproteobacteria bacterium]|nr:hypothetical protein [Gammaproteobacteria bacterium]